MLFINIIFTGKLANTINLEVATNISYQPKDQNSINSGYSKACKESANNNH